VDRQELERLLTPRVLAAVDAEPAPTGQSDVLARSTALRRAGFSPDETATILTQAKLRRRAVAKFGDFASRMLFTRSGLEQATRLDVAAHHANRFRGLGVPRIADLGCGIGGDSLAFAAVDLDVLAVERDPVTAALASYNLAPFPEVDVRVGDAEEADLTAVGAAWLDPARRSAGHDDTHRVTASEYAPSLEFAFGLADRIPVGVKLSPAHDRAALPEHAEAQWVSSGGDVVETALWFGDLRRPGIRRAALVVTARGAAELTAGEDSPDEAPGALGGYLHEPDGAVIRARLLGDLARSTGTRPVDAGIAYLTGDLPLASPFVTSFEIQAVLPFDRLRIRRELKARQVGRLEIKKRGVDLDPATFRTFLGLAGDGEATLIVTRTPERRVALICRRLGAGDGPEG
jgi:SAM-dependent methyltransferase